MAEAIMKSLNALSIRIDSFDGSDNCQPQQFVDSLNRYLETTGKVSPDFIEVKVGEEIQIVPNPRKGVLEKEILRMHLKGDAKSWFKNLDPKLSYTQCCEQLVARFKLTDQQKHARKLEVFQMQQRPGESYSSYVSRVCDAAAPLNLQEKEILTIVMLGADPSIRYFLIMQEPRNIEELMALPLARGESKRMDTQFVGAVAKGPPTGNTSNQVTSDKGFDEETENQQQREFNPNRQRDSYQRQFGRYDEHMQTRPQMWSNSPQPSQCPECGNYR